jgi:hypothetical protein
MGFNPLTGRNAGLAGLRHPQLLSCSWQITAAYIGVGAALGSEIFICAVA